MNYLAIAMLSVMSGSVSAAINTASGLEALNDQELAAETGQALFNMSYIAPTDATNLMNGKNNAGTSVGSVGFYKLGLEGELELNTNIRNLQVGCGGVNGADGCDIDIKNLALSGLPDGGSYNNLGVPTPNGGYDVDGNPVFLNGRASTSAKLTNPFMEFAIKNPGSAATREVLGFRLSAEKISGLLTAGLLNNAGPTTTDGIQSLSGFMRVAATTGDVVTKPVTFGKRPNEQIQGLLNALNINRTFTSQPTDPDTKGVTVPSINPTFSLPAFQVNGSRNTQAVATGIKATINSIPLDAGPLNQLKVTFPALLLGIGSEAKIKLKAGSRVDNLNLDITFNQALSMIHNIPLTGTGGYLALQNQNILWPGSYVDSTDASKNDLSLMTKTDIARAGWWMSFADPVQLGYLKATDPVNISSALPQIASLMTTELLKEQNRVYVPSGDAISTLFGTVIETPNPIVVDLNAATTLNPARITLGNIQLRNQTVVPNCYGTLKFC